jgi:hypothetical protein
MTEDTITPAPQLPTEIRLAFEDAIYKQYLSARTLHMVMHGKKGMADIDKDEPIPRERYLEKRANGDQAYMTAGVNLSWMGWKLALDYLGPVIERASLWERWVEAQAAMSTQLPEGYKLALIHERLKEGDAGVNAWIEVYEPGGDSIPYADPDLEAPGALFRIIDAGITAAIVHDTEGANGEGKTH